MGQRKEKSFFFFGGEIPAFFDHIPLKPVHREHDKVGIKEHPTFHRDHLLVITMGISSKANVSIY